ncbi:hypothetical protein TNCV_3870541 [Trichonephila clavipes]|nr:hypothetical protein TNCV_3870541 [Trichonephila clavipes]
MELAILNYGQMTRTTYEVAPALLTSTPHQREDSNSCVKDYNFVKNIADDQQRQNLKPIAAFESQQIEPDIISLSLEKDVKSSQTAESSPCDMRPCFVLLEYRDGCALQQGQNNRSATCVT